MEVEACGFTGCHILLSEKRTPYKSDEKRRKGRMREIERGIEIILIYASLLLLYVLP
jgi:hypothetical protein